MTMAMSQDPWSELRDLQRQMERIFGQIMGGEFAQEGFGREKDFPTRVKWNKQRFGKEGEGKGFKEGKGRGFKEGKRFFRDRRGGELREWRPLMDVMESDQYYIILFDLPGLQKDKVNLEIKDNILCLCGDRPDKWGMEKGLSFHRNERGTGRFSRQLELPQGIDANRIEANMHDGLLEIKIAKPHGEKSQEKGKTIEVREGKEGKLGKEGKGKEFKEGKEGKLGKEGKGREFKEGKEGKLKEGKKEGEKLGKEGKHEGSSTKEESRDPTFMRAGGLEGK